MTTKTPSSAGVGRSRGRPREFDMDEVLDRAVQVFRERGYYAASIGELSKAMRLTEGSLYKAFKDKHTLFAMAFEHYCARRREGLRSSLPAGASGREQLRAALDYYVKSSTGQEGQRGCLIVGSVSVLGLLDDDLAQQVLEALKYNESALVTLIRNGQADGSIAQKIDATAVAKLMWCLLLGIRVAGKTGKTRKELNEIVEQAMGLLG